jgi:hypothetical protein
MGCGESKAQSPQVPEIKRFENPQRKKCDQQKPFRTCQIKNATAKSLLELAKNSHSR